jgi:tetratricopeptide (TPR) repeat protein
MHFSASDRLRVYLRLFGPLLLAGLLTACSQRSDSRLSKGYHNLTAHYNAYIIARDEFDLAENALLQARQDNYNQLIPILLPADSATALPVMAYLDDAIKKASLIADRHQNSKWLDNAYTLIGKARLYKQHLPDAVEVFKYVNTKGTDENDKHEALVGLMRAYVELGDFTNALNVAEYVRVQPLNKDNTRDYYLTKAYLHQRKNEYATAAAILDAVFPLLGKGPETARLHLIAGQLYDLVKQPAKATAHYKNALDSRPTYDQSFYANIFLMQSDGTKANTSFAKLLNDRKNVDLKDKIYYTMGLLEARRGNTDKALTNYRLSIANTTSNTVQVPFTYLEMGKLYFEQKRDYVRARAYYDSSLALLPQQSTEYVAVAARKKLLDEFVEQYAIAQLEDSLQALTRLNPAELDKLLDAAIARAEALDREKAALAAQITGRPSGANQPGATNSNLSPDQRWLLYNPVQLLQGQQQFAQRWGSRPLEDNWRRSSKEATPALASDANAGNATPANSLTTTAAPAGTVPANAGVVAQNVGVTQPYNAGLPLNRQKAQKDAMYQTIPFSTDALARSNQRLETAWYRVGKMYKIQFDQPAQAIQSFDKLLTRFPVSTYKPEAYYLLFLANEQLGKLSSYKEKLLTEFPNSSYARQLGRVSATDRNTTRPAAGTETSAQQTYAMIYGLYMSGNVTEALARAESALAGVTGTQVEDKLALLRVLLTGKVRGADAYRTTLTEFVRDYPASPLVAYAKELEAAVAQPTANRK